MTTSSSASFDPRVDPQIDEHDAAAIVAWAHKKFGSSEPQSGLVLTASFEDPVLVHLVATHAPGTPVVLLDTQYLFAETLWLVEKLQSRLKFPLEVIHPLADVQPDDQWQFDVEGCCGRRKVEPLNRALAGRAGWITGIRRVDGPTRVDTPVAQFDEARGLTKINPLVAWSDEDIEAYIVAHDLPRNPLIERGYPSIGCWPCTRPVPPGQDKRAGRWAGQTKTECGLHVSTSSTTTAPTAKEKS